MSTRENIRLDDALRQKDKALSFSGQSLAPADWRENTKLIIFGGLSAISLLAIAYVIYTFLTPLATAVATYFFSQHQSR
jgi:hypothetical protein